MSSYLFFGKICLGKFFLLKNIRQIFLEIFFLDKVSFLSELYKMLQNYTKSDKMFFREKFSFRGNILEKI